VIWTTCCSCLPKKNLLNPKSSAHRTNQFVEHALHLQLHKNYSVQSQWVNYLLFMARWSVHNQYFWTHCLNMSFFTSRELKKFYWTNNASWKVQLKQYATNKLYPQQVKTQSRSLILILPHCCMSNYMSHCTAILSVNKLISVELTAHILITTSTYGHREQPKSCLMSLTPHCHSEEPKSYLQSWMAHGYSVQQGATSQVWFNIFQVTLPLNIQLALKEHNYANWSLCC